MFNLLDLGDRADARILPIDPRHEEETARRVLGGGEGTFCLIRFDADRDDHMREDHSAAEGENRKIGCCQFDHEMPFRLQISEGEPSVMPSYSL